MTGNCRGPSSAFCLLYKFFTMKLTVKQMHGLLKHPDSPYIRAIGFLYLRYVADPKTLWGWCDPYIKDEEEFSPGSNGRMTTMGVYVRDLLLGQYYFDTLFPRVPVPVLRQITSNLEKLKLPTKHSGVTGDSSRHGWDDTARRPPSVKAALSVSFGQRAPHRASTRDASPIRRTITPPRDRNHSVEPRSSPGHRRSHSREGPDRHHSDRDRPHDRDRDRDRDRGRDRDRRHDHDSHSDRDVQDRDSYRSRHSARDGSRRDYERSGRDSSHHRGGSRHSRSRSRSLDRLRDVSKDKAASVSSNLAKLKDLYGDASGTKGNGNEYKHSRDTSSEEVIRLGGSTWR
ncbi:pre-mRNA splicing factor SR-like 1 isoform X2 [Phalaenopsis equestris]|nr:pre-mRNA splicing factor SR-like 1 isoform X2 [Phalaenopsis equestris]